MIDLRLLPLLLLPCQGLALDSTEVPNIPLTSPASDEPEVLRGLVDTLEQGSLQEAFRLLTKDYINHPDLDPLEVNRAALQGLLSRLDFGAMLLTEKSRSERDSPYDFYQIRVDPRTAYLRFGRFHQNGLTQLDEALAEFSAAPEITALIVALRSPQAQSDFTIAASILSRFCPPNELLFKIRRPGNERPTLFVSEPVAQSWQKPLLLLVDGETGNTGEIIAAVLKRQTECLVIGEKTPGLTVEYRDVAIGEDRILRYAIAEVVLEDDSSIFQVGISPDIVTPTPRATKHAIYKAVQGGKALTDFLFPPLRPHMNEASLVAGTDPEIDYYLLLSNNKPTPWDEPIPFDRVLVQAVDLPNATSFLEPSKKILVR